MCYAILFAVAFALATSAARAMNSFYYECGDDTEVALAIAIGVLELDSDPQSGRPIRLFCRARGASYWETPGGYQNGPPYAISLSFEEAVGLARDLTRETFGRPFLRIARAVKCHVATCTRFAGGRGQVQFRIVSRWYGR
jgi:hypothetical protein